MPDDFDDIREMILRRRKPDLLDLGGGKELPKRLPILKMTREQWRDIYKQHLKRVAKTGLSDLERAQMREFLGPVEGTREVKRITKKALRYVAWRNRLARKFLKVIK